MYYGFFLILLWFLLKFVMFTFQHEVSGLNLHKNLVTTNSNSLTISEHKSCGFVTSLKVTAASFKPEIRLCAKSRLVPNAWANQMNGNIPLVPDCVSVLTWWACSLIPSFKDFPVTLSYPHTHKFSGNYKLCKLSTVDWGAKSCDSFPPILSLKVLGTSVGLCKTTKRKNQLYISLLVSVWRIICENLNPKRTHISWDMNENINKENKKNYGFGEALQ